MSWPRRAHQSAVAGSPHGPAVTSLSSVTGIAPLLAANPCRELAGQRVVWREHPSPWALIQPCHSLAL